MDSLKLFKKMPYLGSIIPGIIGLTAFLGYIISNHALKSIIPVSAAMNPATAIAFILAGISLFLLCQDWKCKEKTNNIFFRIGFACAVAVALVGAVKLGGILLARDVYIDSHIFVNQLNEESYTTGVLNRMAAGAAANFFLVGVALILLYKNKKKWHVHVLSLIIFYIALFALLGHLYGVKYLTGFTRNMPIAINTAVAFVVLSLGIHCARSNGDPTSIMLREGAGGILMRKLILAVILVPSFLGYVGLAAQRASIVSNELGLALVIVFNIIIFSVLIWWAALKLNSLSIELQGHHEMLEQKVRDRTQDLDQAKNQVEKKLKEVEQLNKMLVGREFKMIELKQEIERLTAQIANHHCS